MALHAGWVQDGKAYEWDIVVWNASGVASPAVRSGFTVAYPAPAALAWAEATLAANRRDVEPNSVLVSWAQTGYAAGSLVAYAIRRRRADQSEAEAVLVRLVRVAGQGNWTDHHAPPNVDLVYAVSQIVQQAGVGAVESPAVEAEARVAVTVPTAITDSTPVSAMVSVGVGALTAVVLAAPVVWVVTEVLVVMVRLLVRAVPVVMPGRVELVRLAV